MLFSIYLTKQVST